MQTALSSFFRLLALPIYYAVLFSAWVEHKFRGEPGPTEQWMEVQRRDYEWEDKAYCDHCDTVTSHRYIEWTAFDGSVTTDECKWCRTVVTFDIATRFE